MVKQEQNHSSDPNEERKKAHKTPQGSHKEKAVENQGTEKQEGFMQGLESQDEKRKSMTQKKHPRNDFDRNEGEERSQKS